MLRTISTFSSVAVKPALRQPRSSLATAAAVMTAAIWFESLMVPLRSRWLSIALWEALAAVIVNAGKALRPRPAAERQNRCRQHPPRND